MSKFSKIRRGSGLEHQCAQTPDTGIAAEMLEPDVH